MGKLIISTHITVDGVIGPNPGEWGIFEGEGERYKYDQLLAADAFVLGRKVYEGLASYWPTATDDTGFAERTNSLPKYVASRTLKGPLTWNASLIRGDLAESVTTLKRQHRGNLISVYKHNAELLKKVGTFVNAGEIISIVGNSGEMTDGPHLHFELWYNGNPLNPEEFVTF